jgi:hypothetical protein
LFAAAIECDQVFGTDEAMPRNMRENGQIAVSELKRRGQGAPLEAPGSRSFHSGIHD